MLTQSRKCPLGAAESEPGMESPRPNPTPIFHKPAILRRMERLWTPWRYEYITRADEPSSCPGVPAALSAWTESGAADCGCVFCNLIAAVDYAVARGMPIAEAEMAAHVLVNGVVHGSNQVAED